MLATKIGLFCSKIWQLDILRHLILPKVLFVSPRRDHQVEYTKQKTKVKYRSFCLWIRSGAGEWGGRYKKHMMMPKPIASVLETGLTSFRRWCCFVLAPCIAAIAHGVVRGLCVWGNVLRWAIYLQVTTVFKPSLTAGESSEWTNSGERSERAFSNEEPWENSLDKLFRKLWMGSGELVESLDNRSAFSALPGDSETSSLFRLSLL